ncbi:MarR family winged helix-turn-helix transcriptional regulator [Streptococcus sp. sy018]|uniref:fatty acid biosynthesis transcriptional regulator FabT n=1 Tax=Streptococcus sp. sy018 TaxID=2600147 RepID=UPI0011B4DCCE|nr:MarR family transcriptional regulator [Streptococcus sp. sy018]TWS95339.1 MarR family transcriptional regulator [Streptococcus sp. sy018]
MEYDQINEYLVNIFNRILIIEETSLRTSQFNDVSLKEIHTIEIIGKDSQVTPSDIARELMVTLGTVTTSLNKLEKKGYVQRTRSDVDRRVVYLSLTKKGRLLNRLHAKFHKSMVTHIIEDLDPTEIDVLTRGLGNLHQFLEDLV